MLNYKEIKNKCTGCFACYNICPEKTINMELDNEGFFYPKIDKKKCINCGLCKKVCPVLNKNNNKNYTPQFACSAWSKNKDILVSSSSGGLFSEFAKYILNHDGKIYGVIYKNNRTQHICIKNEKNLKILRKSKYLQSNIGYSFKEVLASLKNNKKILFCGTPCQIAGLKSFLQINQCQTKNLYTIDLICHGVPSYKVFDDYLNFKFKNEKINLINFRKKVFNWKNFYISYHFRKKTKQIHHLKDEFFRGYLKNYYLRRSCYDCEFAKIPRQGDITLGDFWGIPKKHYNKKGVSLVLSNNTKGEYLFNEILNNIISKELNISPKSINNPRLFSGKYNSLEKRNVFFEEYLTNDFNYIYKKYLKLNLSKKIVLKIKLILEIIKNFI